MSSLDDFSIPHTVLRYFDFSASPYTDAIARDVAERRRTYPGNSLFLDQLLGLAGVDGTALYPPNSPAGLRRLIHTIRSAQIDRLKQDCFIYYLLLDSDHAFSRPIPNGDIHCSNGHVNGGEVALIDKGKGKSEEESESEQAEDFARRRSLPQVWRGFIFGYWALDHGMWEDAVEALSNPGITSLNFLPDIFTLLTTHVSPPPFALSLAHSFFTSLAPPLDSPSLIHLRAISLAASSSLSNAFGFIRSQPPSAQRTIREALYSWALGASRTSYGLGPSSVQPGVLTALLHLPLQADESAHLTHFLTHPPRSIPPPALDLLHELVTVRLIHQGQYAECLALDKELAGSRVGKEEDRQKRRERVKEFIGILPEAQRRVLELEGEVRREGDGRRVEEVVVEGDVEMPIAGPSNPKPNGHVQIVAPIPKRLPSLLSLTGNPSSPHPQSPAARTQPPSRNVSSPFSGPPQFRTNSPAMPPGTPTRHTPAQRLASGSPFVIPPRAAMELEVPRPARRIIDDDEEEAMARRREKRPRQASGSVALTPKPKQAEPESEPESGPETESEADVEMDHQPESPAPAPQKQTDSATQMPPPPVPTPKPKTPARKSARATLGPKARPASPPPPVPQAESSTPARSTRRQTTVPPPDVQNPAEPQPPRKGKGKSKADAAEVNGEAEDVPHDMPGAFTPAPTPRSRLTRSASRAVLDEDQPNPGSPAKRPRTRTRTAPSPAAKAGSPTASEGAGRGMRRSTRELSVASSSRSRASVTPGPGGRGGSPTGSVVSTRSRRAEGSITPRVTRTRK